MSQRPSTPVKVPSSAADYTPATLDPDLRSQINTILLRDGHVPKIQERLLHALNADASNWPTMVQNHALHLLRSGEVLTFPALLRRVLDDIHEATNKAASTTNGSNDDDDNDDDKDDDKDDNDDDNDVVNDDEDDEEEKAPCLDNNGTPAHEENGAESK